MWSPRSWKFWTVHQHIWEHSHGTPITNKDGISINKSEVVPPSNVSMQYWRGHDKTIRAGKDPSWNSLAVNQLREQLLSWTKVCCSSAARAMPLGHSTWSPKFCDQAINLSIYVQYTLMLSGRTLIRFGSRCLLPLLFRVLRRVLPGLFDQLRDPRLLPFLQLQTQSAFIAVQQDTQFSCAELGGPGISVSSKTKGAP